MTPSKLRLALLLIAPLLLAPLASLASDAAGGAEGTYPGYMELTPPLVVNLASARRSQYLRVDIQLFIESQEEADLVAHHMPRIRDRLISLLAGRAADSLMSIEARDALREELLKSLRDAMVEYAGRPAIGALYFTGFIIQ